MCKSERPKLIRDWKGGYIKSREKLENGYGKMPAGTIYKVTSSGPKAYLHSLPCECCGFEFSVSIKGKGKFDNFVWLGYQLPEKTEKNESLRRYHSE